MICQIVKLFKLFNKKIWRISLKEWYRSYVESVQKRSTAIIIAENGQKIQPLEYIMYGTYERSTIYDVQKVSDGEGKWKWTEVKVVGLKIQRIQNRETKETHAVLIDILVPYEQYSLRYILYHLLCFLQRNTTIGEYCAGKRFDEDVFAEWLIWMKEHITVLRGMGLTRNADENRIMLFQWGQDIAKDFQAWEARSLRILRQGLFQRHKMPERSASQCKLHPG